jgi:hypothetical protein
MSRRNFFEHIRIHDGGGHDQRMLPSARPRHGRERTLADAGRPEIICQRTQKRSLKGGQKPSFEHPSETAF